MKISKVQYKETGDKVFQTSSGFGGVSTGSKNVITINMNRLVQDGRDLETELKKIHKYQLAFETWYRELYEQGMLPVYSAGYIFLDKQFLTIGINGIVEAAEYLGYTIGNNDEYKNWLKNILKTIKDLNKQASKKYSTQYGYKIRINTEFVPAENLGVKFSKWDKADGYVVSRDCYNSYFYIVEDDQTSFIDKFTLHGGETLQYLDGGSAYHLNLEEHPTKEGYRKILEIALKEGCNYFTCNIPNTICNDCGFISKHNLQTCTKCDSENVEHATRVIGYLKRIKSFSNDRQIEAKNRYYHS